MFFDAKLNDGNGIPFIGHMFQMYQNNFSFQMLETTMAGQLI